MRKTIDFASSIIEDLPYYAPLRVSAIKAFFGQFEKLDVNLMVAVYTMDPNSRLKYLTKEGLKAVQTKLLAIMYAMKGRQDMVLARDMEFSRYQLLVGRLREDVKDVEAWWNGSRLIILKYMALR